MRTTLLHVTVYAADDFGTDDYVALAMRLLGQSEADALQFAARVESRGAAIVTVESRDRGERLKRELARFRPAQLTEDDSPIDAEVKVWRGSLTRVPPVRLAFYFAMGAVVVLDALVCYVVAVGFRPDMADTTGAIADFAITSAFVPGTLVLAWAATVPAYRRVLWPLLLVTSTIATGYVAHGATTAPLAKQRRPLTVAAGILATATAASVAGVAFDRPRAVDFAESPVD